MITALLIYSAIATISVIALTILYVHDTKKLQEIANHSEDRVGYHFSKLLNIRNMIKENQKTNGNLFYLVKDIQKELDRLPNRI